jgi:predicted RNase H-like nuclease (RuvC/YqgF family)
MGLEKEIEELKKTIEGFWTAVTDLKKSIDEMQKGELMFADATKEALEASLAVQERISKDAVNNAISITNLSISVARLETLSNRLIMKPEALEKKLVEQAAEDQKMYG